MLHGYYRQRLRTLLGSSAAPYGYTLATWTSGAVLTSAQRIPNVLDVLLFMVGAVLGFAFVGALAFGGITKHLDQDHGAAPLIWGSFHFFSVGLAIGVAALTAHNAEGLVAWPLGGFLFTSTYLLVAGAESALAYGWDHRQRSELARPRVVCPAVKSAAGGKGQSP